MNISDDILVYGNCKTSHDENLKAVLTRLEEKGLTLNYNKCEFNTDKYRSMVIYSQKMVYLQIQLKSVQ